MSAKAEVEVDVKGAAQAERDLKKLESSFKGFGRELGGIFAGATREAAGISFALSKVDPASAAQRFRDYRGTVTEWSIATRRSIGDVKASFATLSNQTLLPDEEVADFSRSLGKATYDTHDSAKAVAALRGEGLLTGRSLSEMGGIAETLHNQFGASFDDMPEMLGSIEAAANSMGTAGGPAALEDSIASLGSTLTQVSIKGKQDAKELVDVLAAVSKNARTPEQAKSLQSQLVSHFAAGGEQMRLNLGIKRKDFYDENGNIKVNAENVQRLRDFYLKRSGGNAERAQQLASFSNNLGPQLAAALFRPGLMEDIKKAQAAAPGTGYEDALAKLAGTDHGKETAAQLARDREQRENVGAKVNAAQQSVAGAMPDSSIARYLIGGIGGGIASNLLGKGLSKLGESAVGAAAGLFKVGQVGEQAAVVLKALPGAPAATSIPSVIGGAGLPLLAYGAAKTEAGIREGLYDAREKQKKEQFANAKAFANDDLFYGRKKYGFAHWYSTERSILDVPASEQGPALAQANQQAVKSYLNRPLAPQAPIDVNVKISTDTASPIHVTNVQKGSAGQQ